MKSYETLRDAVLQLGAVLTSENLYPETNQSGFCDFSAKDGSIFRLVWDGTEGCGYLQSMTADKLWKDLSPMVMEVSNDNEERMVKWLKLAKKLTKGAAKPTVKTAKKTPVKKVVAKKAAAKEDLEDIKLVKKRAKGPFIKVNQADL
jgi:hypothetical protein